MPPPKSTKILQFFCGLWHLRESRNREENPKTQDNQVRTKLSWAVSQAGLGGVFVLVGCQAWPPASRP